ncbi:TAXI family TRAP transporter solute-binding subunit [Caldalkalibacillus salinus]|uniref:TAXI family TRAP transporter solute-binding subunit n=1 Tax=Caldalkalibacillus salinus TaxID=2803787 RepID=UPI001923814A|nr:TAXI family TRAP transporter solute-binding subunit [Caldalkalibacillus salinus]
MKKLSVILALLLALGLMLVACGGTDEEQQNGEPGQGVDDGAKDRVDDEHADWVKDVTILTGGEAGVYFPIGVAIGDILDANVEGMTAAGVTSGASLVNVAELDEAEAEMALVQNDMAYYALEGTQMFEGALSGFQGLATLYPETIQIVTTADTGIETVQDLVGKRVAIGDVGSGTEANATQILEAHGITHDDFSVEFMGFGDASTALQDGNVDAAFVTAGTPTGAIQQLGAVTDVRLVSIEAEQIDTLVNKYPYYTEVEISADTYGLDTDVSTVAVQAMLIVREDLPEEQVYEITKAIFDNLQVLQNTHDRGHDITLETALDGMSIDVHPGAQRFYDEP